jgi:hypothetical protein
VIVGDVGAWAENFKRYDERLLERICEILPQCIAALGDNPIEDQITINLVDRFHLDETIRKMFHHWEYQFEPFGHDEKGAAFSKGKIDFVVCWDTEREKYLAYEAKRLNVPTSVGGTSSLATVYVTEGLVRFVKEQYSVGLPVGCMLGYVLDGKVTNVQPKIHAAISKNSKLVGLTDGPKALVPVGTASRFSSVHVRDGSGTHIDIQHALVPCV